jgi:hypothetical protein
MHSCGGSTDLSLFGPDEKMKKLLPEMLQVMITAIGGRTRQRNFHELRISSHS